MDTDVDWKIWFASFRSTGTWCHHVTVQTYHHGGDDKFAPLQNVFIRHILSTFYSRGGITRTDWVRSKLTKLPTK